MEFRCRLASPNGEIVEGVYVADSEARLRHELEEKGLLRPLAPAEGRHRRAVSLQLPQRAAITTREFLVFNQELATLLKAGMPLVQSLDLLQAARRLADRSDACSTTCTRRCGRAPRCRTRSPRTAICFPRVYTASLLAGERSGNLDAVLRRYVEYAKIIATVKRKTVSALVYPAILDLAGARPRRDHRAEGRAGVLGLLRDRSAPSCRSSTRIIVGVSDFVRDAVPADRRRCWRSRSRRRRAGCGSRDSRRGSIALLLRLPCSARSRGSSRPRRWRGRWRRCSAAACRSSTRSTSPRESIGNQYMAGQLDIVSARVREGRVVRGGARSAAVVSRSRGQDGRSRRVDRRAAGHAEHASPTSTTRRSRPTWSGSSRWSSRSCSSIMGIVIAGLLLALYMPLFQLSSVLAR